MNLENRMLWNLPGIPEFRANREGMNSSFYTARIVTGERAGTNTHLQ